MSDTTFLSGGGELGAITRSYNWSETSIGPPEHWPQSLRTTLSIILNSKFPMFLFWGPELICFYNDAYRPSLGNNGKHPAVGQKGADLWPEIWDGIKPIIDTVLSGGEASWNEDMLLPIYRNGRLEDVYWTFSYSPVFDETNMPVAVFVTCTETTEKVKSLQELLKAQELQKVLNDEISAVNEELIASNEELAALNEELNATNEELQQSSKDLEHTNRDLWESKRQVQFAIDAAKLATWDLDPLTMKFEGNSRLRYWFGLDPNDLIDLSKATDVILESDRPAVLAAIERAMQVHSDGNYDIDYTIINPDHKPRIVKARGKALFDEDGQVTRFSGTLQDVTEQKQDELRKSDFIGMVSHELKTPLTSIKGFIQMLQLKASRQGDEFAVKVLDKADRQINKMTSMVNGFLNLQRLESGKLHLNIERFNLEALINETVEEIHLLHPHFHIPLLSGKAVFVNADRNKIGNVVSNLLSNAVKYSPKGGTITITCNIVGQFARVGVNDEGIGIAEQEMEHLFDRYYRVESSDNISGFGIGLYLSSEIVQAHQGTIWVESEIEKGSTFYFNLPSAE